MIAKQVKFSRGTNADFIQTLRSRVVGYFDENNISKYGNWKIQHNVLHHSFTNVVGMDEDISPPAWLLRFSPHTKRYMIHRMQHIYGWALYALETLMWCTSKDFVGLVKYRREGLLKKEDGKFGMLITKTFLWKLVYFGYILVLPMVFAPVAWWVVLIGFFIMHIITGLFVALVFQSAHVMPDMEYPLPDDQGNLENNWAVHQILTTTNFAPKSNILGWYIGGLNYQIEHHLFPNICHIHYKKISKIVKETAAEYGLPYQCKQYFVDAIADHARMLRDLGRYDVLPTTA
jgi:linoleoyl-CoA desaturase